MSQSSLESYSSLKAFSTTFKLSERDILQYFDTTASWDSTTVDPTNPWNNAPKRTKHQHPHRLRTSKRSDKNHDLLHRCFCKDLNCPTHN
jgi:hypothetical protein